MSLSIVDRLDDSVTAARTFLLPFNLGRWLRLTLLALFLGTASSSTGGVVSALFSANTSASMAMVPTQFSLPVIGFLGLLAGGFALIGGYLASLSEFVFVDALATRDVTIRASAVANAGRAVRLFLFRLALLALVAVFLLPPVLFVLGIPVGPLVGITAVGLFVVGLLIVAPVVAIAHGLTTAFVVPAMYDGETGVLAGWRRLWPQLGDNLLETAGYVIFAAVLSGAGATAVGTVIGTIATVLAVVVGIVGLVVVGVSGGLALIVLVPVVVTIALLLSLVAAALHAPILVGLRYYALLVLADLSDVDLLELTRETTTIAPPREA